MGILEFFRDFLSGITYWIYLAACIFAFFFVLGIVSDRKRIAISDKLKEKKSYDIKSGREAAIAAMETKQVLDVMAKETPKPEENNQVPSSEAPKEEVPQVMVINSTEQSTQPKQEEPVVFEATPVQNPNIQQ